ncbi:uncharacterized protein LOC6541904 [Drosophila erecta]|uniref:Uncharacterized protein n=1 Tax=Drosophila erecta TaxID=7220 RepID=B3N6N6_DROER|nr:uncharacterized protein LOC6541904 [Drosophila erecta]EDV59252.1 uncharacterized protein Dere_GG10495 [Drosophila erecta]
MTNRLALHHILTTQLRRDWEQEESAKTRLSQLSRRERIKASLRSSQLPGRFLLPDTRKTYDNMVANIHSTMKSVRTPRKPRPTEPLVPAGNSSPIPVPSKLVPKPPRRNKSGRIRGGANSSKANSAHGFAAQMNHKSLATIKASINQKPKGSRGLEQNNRLREVIQQKKVLETMLQQHKKLQTDRHTIAMDIQRMRADLDKIRTRLDTSLQSLNSTRTLFNSANKASLRRATVLPKNTQNLVTSTHRRSGGKRKVRTVAIPMSRQSVLANKAPILKRRVR